MQQALQTSADHRPASAARPNPTPRVPLLPCLAIAGLWSFASAAQPQAELARKLAVLERFVGTWDVVVQVKRPAEKTVSYTEVAVLAPGKRLLRGDTGPKSDGHQDWTMTTFDQASGGYPMWIFSSSGVWYYLAPGQWDEAKLSIEWKSPPLLPVSHVTRCSFADARTRRCHTLVKDFLGKVVLEQEYTARRREP
jgi:hypothetical protein